MQRTQLRHVVQQSSVEENPVYLFTSFGTCNTVIAIFTESNGTAIVQRSRLLPGVRCVPQVSWAAAPMTEKIQLHWNYLKIKLTKTTRDTAIALSLKIIKICSLLGISHFVWLLLSRGACKQDGKCQSSWTCTFCIWFATEVHFATVSSGEDDEEADQYIWFTMLCTHSRTSLHPFLFATASSFLLSPAQIFTYIRFSTWIYQFVTWFWTFPGFKLSTYECWVLWAKLLYH